MMMRGVRIVVCLLLIVSVATILITPDQTDDVPGVLHHIVKLQKFMAVWASLFSSVALLSARATTSIVPARTPDPPELLTLLCVRLC